jgi:hypothetical protein
MNSKKARALRAEAGYHPMDERKQLTIKKLVSKTETKIHRIENDPESSRAKYRALKSASRS